MVIPDTVIVETFKVNHTGAELLIEAAVPDGIGKFQINKEDVFLNFEGGRATHAMESDQKGALVLVKSANSDPSLYHISAQNGKTRIKHIPLWLSVVPPLIAIILALIFKEVVVSLFAGIWTGAFIAGGMRIDSFYYFFMSFLEVIQTYIMEALNDFGHLAVIVFSLLIGGMVAIISKNGGMAGVVLAMSKYARSPKSSQFITWLLGVAIFFDDYANTLIVGNTMRSVTDKFKISREKLAYIVDSTAAPVAAIAFITTWIGAELGYIHSGTKLLPGFEDNMTPYSIFLSSLKYSYYPAFTLIFILFLIFLKKDFGPMLKAEIRARTTGDVSKRELDIEEETELENLDPKKGAPLKWYNAAIPVFVVILVTIFGLLDTGFAATNGELLEKGIMTNGGKWSEVWSQMNALLVGDDTGIIRKMGKLIGNADSFVALLWASLMGVFVAIVLTLGGKIMRIGEVMNSMVMGFKTMIPALIILVFAWSLATTTEVLHTAEYLTLAMEGNISPLILPVIVFILAAFISFSTGSSWSTMAILYPIAIPTTWAICLAAGLDYDHSLEILLNVISVTLAASVLGDHCSPISDTTILSSLASSCNHIDHVRTQLPYAMTVGVVSLVCGGISTLLGGGWLICFILFLTGIAILFFIVWKIGKDVPDPVAEIE
ncbi:MAG: Na+/H+ antiporter NhaC family protein [Saprospiraceae bacterium]|nr:Na+/H+ antiporter NhaC family protein [Saprospiraceae bacterium]